MYILCWSVYRGHLLKGTCVPNLNRLIFMRNDIYNLFDTDLIKLKWLKKSMMTFLNENTLFMYDFHSYDLIICT